MKTKHLLIFAVFLSFCMVSCEKSEESKPKVKYITKVLYSDSDFEAKSFTWDAQGRLKTFKHNYCYEKPELTFHYNSSGLICHIDAFYFEYGYGYFLLYWKNNQELDYIDLYMSKISPQLHDDPFYLDSRYTYSYGQDNKCMEIHREGQNHNTRYCFEWDKNNVTKIYHRYYEDTSYYLKSNSYDHLRSAFSALPDFPLMLFSDVAFCSSQNNPLGNRSDFVFDYDYDGEGYPIRQYYYENGERIAIYDFEYEER